MTKSKHGYKTLGRHQWSFEDHASQRLSYGALPIALYLGLPYKNWHLKETVPKKIADAAMYRELLIKGIIPAGEWSQVLFGTTTEPDHAIICEFITTHAKDIVREPSRLLAGGGGALSPITFASALIAGYVLLQKKFPNKRHVTISDLQKYLDNLHYDIRSSHVIRFVNGIANKDWYPFEEKRLQILIPDKETRILFQRILAVTAIRTAANSNATIAVRAFHQLKNNLPFTGFQGTVIKGLEKIRSEGAFSSKSTKTLNYTDALHGDMKGVAVDRWLTLQFGANRQYEHRGKKQSLAPSLPLQRAIKAYITEVAYYTKCKPAEIAAMMWFAERTRNGNKTDRGYATTLTRKFGTLFPLFEE